MSKVKEVVDYMVRIGTEKTMSGNWHFEFDEIEEMFGVKVDDEFKEAVSTEAWNTGKLLDIEVVDDFDFMFCLSCCPNA